MQIRLVGQHADPLLVVPGDLLQARDDPGPVQGEVWPAGSAFVSAGAGLRGGEARSAP